MNSLKDEKKQKEKGAFSSSACVLCFCSHISDFSPRRLDPFP